MSSHFSPALPFRVAVSRVKVTAWFGERVGGISFQFASPSDAAQPVLLSPWLFDASPQDARPYSCLCPWPVQPWWRRPRLVALFMVTWCFLVQRAAHVCSKGRPHEYEYVVFSFGFCLLQLCLNPVSFQLSAASPRVGFCSSQRCLFPVPGFFQQGPPQPPQRFHPSLLITNTAQLELHRGFEGNWLLGRS